MKIKIFYFLMILHISGVKYMQFNLEKRTLFPMFVLGIYKLIYLPPVHVYFMLYG